MSETERKQIEIFTDGSCRGNPGPGGFAYILSYRGRRKEGSGGFQRTTNNRMELMALVRALEALKEPCEVTVYTDSKYLMGGFEKFWVKTWKRNGWLTKAKEPVQNRDLWEALDGLMQEHTVVFHWVKGHADHDENNRCDELAVAAARAPGLPRDEGYEATRKA